MSKEKDIKYDLKAGFEKFYEATGQDINVLGMHPDVYEEVSKSRYEQTIEVLNTEINFQENMNNLTVCDIGCGPGGMLNRLDDSNIKIGMDGYDFSDKNKKNYFELPFEFHQADFDREDFADKIGENSCDVVMSFETLEHLSNPYNFFIQIKKMLKEGGTFILSYPRENMQHNTFYPGLLYDDDNFAEFVKQVAFGCVHHFSVETRYGFINLYVLRNLSWDKVKMKWPKTTPSFAGQPPHIQINL